RTTLPSAEWQDRGLRHIQAASSRYWLPLHRRAQGRHDCQILGLHRSYGAPQEIDDRENRDPDNIQRMPEQREAKDAALNVGAKTLGEDLRHHGEKPEDASRDMHA